MVKTGDDLPKALGFAITFPFPDAILAAIHGDYVNIDLDVNLALKRAMANQLGGGEHDGPTLPGGGPLPPLPPLPLPPLPLPLPPIPLTSLTGRTDGSFDLYAVLRTWLAAYSYGSTR